DAGGLAVLPRELVGEELAHALGRRTLLGELDGRARLERLLLGERRRGAAEGEARLALLRLEVDDEPLHVVDRRLGDGDRDVALLEGAVAVAEPVELEPERARRIERDADDVAPFLLHVLGRLGPGL